MGIESKSYRETEMLELLVRILHPNNPKTDELHSEYQPVAERLAEEEGDNYLDLRRQLERAARYPTARKDGLTILEQYGLLSNDNPRERSEGSYITRLITRVA
ncbi:hypothetical protein COV16_00910, partial [Candidatus Woesearchaeota archaeon CG10_big_fil_rev_8_21_14_0_10_34_8]